MSSKNKQIDVENLNDVIHKMKYILNVIEMLEFEYFEHENGNTVQLFYFMA